LQDRQEVVDSNSSESEPEAATSHQQDSQFEEYDEEFSSSLSESGSEEEKKFQPRRANVHDRFTRNQGRTQRPSRRQAFDEDDRSNEEQPARRRPGRPRKRGSSEEEFDSDDREIIETG
jgi:hypothetical protein